VRLLGACEVICEHGAGRCIPLNIAFPGCFGTFFLVMNNGRLLERSGIITIIANTQINFLILGV
jgi:hypothetical protein